MKACALRIFLIFLTIFFFPWHNPYVAGSASITDYRPLFLEGRTSSGEMRIAIRQFRKDNLPYLLLVNPFSLETSTVPGDSFSPLGDKSAAMSRGTPYISALERHNVPPWKLQNYGMAHAHKPVQGVFLTVDMCPSAKPFERDFFEYLAEISKKRGKVAPVAVAITGNWLLNHREEFQWIVGRFREGKIAVTWVNHSFSHPFAPGTPLERNFLLTPGTDFEHEVLETERILLENCETPSPFFRFPGLVSDGTLMEKLRRMSLIPVGSDAWLAKGEKPKGGSIILVHGNGNEPSGIRAVLQFLKGNEGIMLLPLCEAVSDCGRRPAE
jgi:peptidoglycan/xylan/chitin deacetylase (PgdA/CDA1 family)